MYYSFLYTLPSSIEYYYKKTVLIAIGTLGAAAVNIALNAYFIPRFGYIAAAYTTVVCYLLYYAIHVFFAWKVHGGILYDMKNQLLWLFWRHGGGVYFPRHDGADLAAYGAAGGRLCMRRHLGAAAS